MSYFSNKSRKYLAGFTPDEDKLVHFPTGQTMEIPNLPSSAWYAPNDPFKKLAWIDSPFEKAMSKFT